MRAPGWESLPQELVSVGTTASVVSDDCAVSAVFAAASAAVAGAVDAVAAEVVVAAVAVAGAVVVVVGVVAAAADVAAAAEQYEVAVPWEAAFEIAYSLSPRHCVVGPADAE